MASIGSRYEAFTRISKLCWSFPRLHSRSYTFRTIHELPYWFCHLYYTSADNTALYARCYPTSDLWQQLELVFKLESDLRDTVDWRRKQLLDFNVEKTGLVSFDWFNKTDVKLDRSVLDKKIYFKMLGLNLSSNLDWGWYIISIAETASQNIGAFNCSVKLFPLRLLCISVNLPYDHAWNTVVLSGLVLLDITWNC